MNPRLSRRHFLRLAGAAAVAPLVSACGDRPGGGAPSERVVVIGAGFSGLTVANALATAGREVVVLEARDRIGGRTWTVDVDGATVDLGGAWIHGPIGNPVACFAAANGIGWSEADVVSAHLSAYDPGAGFLPPDFLLDFGVVSASFEAALPALRSSLGPGASLADGAARFLDDQGLTGDRRRFADFAIRQGLGELFYGGPASLTSLAAFYDDVEFAGGNHFPDGGYRRLVGAMAAGLDVRSGEVVSRVEYGEHGIEISTSRGSYAGSAAVVTVPLGVLQSGAIAFDPPLPAAKASAIARLDMGNFEKIVLRFDDAFWLAGGRRDFVYLSPTYGELPIYFDLTRFVGVPTLLCFYAGQFAREAAAMSDAALRQRVLEILAEMLGGPVPAPRDVRLTRWKNDPYALGSYSYIPVGASHADMEALAEPVGSRLFFAGEATEPRYYGTVHAAMLSGLREAKRILGTEQVLLSSGPAPDAGCAGPS